MAWSRPVYDRTQADIDEAIRIVREWKANGEADISDLKGCFNATDMNRIENNIKYLSDTLTDLYYFSSVTTKTWGKDGLPTVTDVKRLTDNVQKIISSYHQSSSAPALPNTLSTFEEVNDLEENLHYLKSLLDNMIQAFPECGAYTCGEG
jgi:hypothetical protein